MKTIEFTMEFRRKNMDEFFASQDAALISDNLEELSRIPGSRLTLQMRDTDENRKGRETCETNRDKFNEVFGYAGNPQDPFWPSEPYGEDGSLTNAAMFTRTFGFVVPRDGWWEELYFAPVDRLAMKYRKLFEEADEDD